jgi:hypothetical protein
VNSRTVLLVLCSCFFVQACAGTPKGPPEGLLSLSEAQMKIRSYQTRAFDIESKDKVVRGVVAALQDLGFIIERANAPMGLVTAGRFLGGGFVELTVTVRRKGTSQNEVRVNALFNTQPIEDPKIYQNFFIAVEKSLFISS